MWHDYAVETFKRHVEYKKSATQTGHPGYCNGNSTVQGLVFWEVYMVYVV